MSITEEAADAAAQWLVDHAEIAAGARADRVYVEEYRKSLKAILMKEHDGAAAVLQEREAYADPRYVKHLQAIRDAVFHDEKMRFLKEAKLATIDAWQTQSANQRGMERRR